MKDSEKILVEAFVIIVIGLVFLGVSRSINIPSAYNTFLGIPYSVSSEFVSSFNEMLVLFMLGTLLVGFGLGEFVIIITVRKLEKKISETPPP